MCESFVLGQRSLRGNPLDTQRLAGEKGLRASCCAWKLHRWSAPVASKREIPLPVKYNELFITLPCFYFFRSNNFPFFLFIFWGISAGRSRSRTYRVPPGGLAATNRFFNIFLKKAELDEIISWSALACRSINLREAAASIPAWYIRHDGMPAPSVDRSIIQQMGTPSGPSASILFGLKQTNLNIYGFPFGRNISFKSGNYSSARCRARSVHFGSRRQVRSVPCYRIRTFKLIPFESAEMIQFKITLDSGFIQIYSNFIWDRCWRNVISAQCSECQSEEIQPSGRTNSKNILRLIKIICLKEKDL